MTLGDIPQIQQLTKAEKLQLVADLWDEIAAMPDESLITNEEKALLEERLQAHRLSPDSALTLDAFKERLSERL